MRLSRIDIKRDETVIQVENWPTAEDTVASSNAPSTLSTLSTGMAVELEVTASSTNIAVLSTGSHQTPVCRDGVCQLGDWKPNRNVA